MKRYFPLLFVTVVIAGLALVLRYHNLTSPSEILSDPQNAAPPTREAHPEGEATPSPLRNAPSAEGVRPAFVEFLQAEARSIESPQIDSDLAERRIKEQAAAMGENEIRYARDLALGDENAANQRIVAAFLLGAAGPKGRAACRELVLAPTNSARAEPHTVAEVKNAQTKSLGGMCAEALFEQAKTDSAAREELARWAKEAKDATIQKLLAQKLRELPPQ